MNARELWQYIDRLNDINDFDLAWEWKGQDDEPWVRVYEQAENHELCGGSMDNIQERIRKALPGWHLQDVMD